MRLVGLKCLRVIGDIGGRNMSKIEDMVMRKIQARAVLGRNKYNITMERTDLSRKDWLIHAQEEALDLAVYLQKLILLEDE